MTQNPLYIYASGYYILLLSFIYVHMLAQSLQSYLTMCGPMDCSLIASSVHGTLQGKNTGVGCHDFLQGIFLTQGMNPCLLHWQADSLPLTTREAQGSSYHVFIAEKLAPSCPQMWVIYTPYSLSLSFTHTQCQDIYNHSLLRRKRNQTMAFSYRRRAPGI